MKIKSKSDITKEIIRLRDFDYTVLTFQNNKIGRGGIKGMTDYFVVGKGRMFFIEGKFGDDELSKSQKELMLKIKSVEIRTDKTVRHFIATENNVYQIIDGIIGRTI